MSKHKRGQVTIFIIIAILVVAMVVLFFMFRGKVGEKAPTIPEAINPNSFLKTCMEDIVEETAEILSMQGGYMENPLSINFQFKNERPWDISYLCYTSQVFTPCNVIQPLLINHIESEIKKEISGEMSLCFNDLAESYRDKGYTVTQKYTDFETDLVEDKLVVELLDSALTTTKADQTTRQQKFKMEFPTKLHGTLLVANEIISQQATYCSFSELGYMAIHPYYNILPPQFAPNSTWIYTVTHETTNEKFRFAIRSCVSPI